MVDVGFAGFLGGYRVHGVYRVYRAGNRKGEFQGAARN